MSSTCSGKLNITHSELIDVTSKMKDFKQSKREKRLRLAIWNFSGLGSKRKQKEIKEVLVMDGRYFLAGQESWEREDTKFDIGVISDLGSLVEIKLVKGGKVVLAF